MQNCGILIRKATNQDNLIKIFKYVSRSFDWLKLYMKAGDGVLNCRGGVVGRVSGFISPS